MIWRPSIRRLMKKEERERKARLEAAQAEQRRRFDAGEQNFWMDPPTHIMAEWGDPAAQAMLRFMGVEITRPADQAIIIDHADIYMEGCVVTHPDDVPGGGLEPPRPEDTGT